MKNISTFALSLWIENEGLIRQYLSGSQEDIHRLPATAEATQDPRALCHPKGNLFHQRALRHRLAVQPDEGQQVPRQSRHLV